MTVQLSVVVITKNEAANLAECLDSVRWAEEIVVYDSGSTDATVEIARRYTTKVFVDTDWQGYGVHRQRAQSKASGAWIFMLDADERVTPFLCEELLSVTRGASASALYSVPRLSYCFGRFIRHGGWYPDRVVRLYPAALAGYDDALVHERVHPQHALATRKLRGDILHYTYRDLEHYLVKSAHYAAQWSSQRFGRGKRADLATGIVHGIGCFLRMYVFKSGFLDGKAGFLLALLSAHSTFVKYADLWLRGAKKTPR
ncbi:MAG: glycosyltransferase family 2 protein [Pseudomonadota bacterium]